MSGREPLQPKEAHNLPTPIKATVAGSRHYLFIVYMKGGDLWGARIELIQKIKGKDEAPPPPSYEPCA